MPDLSLRHLARHPASSLSDHVQQCMLASGPMHRVHCAAETVHGVLAHRFVTTLVVVAIVLAVGGWSFFS